MKFAYVDESGDHSQGDVFVMAGVLIDAYRLRKHTAKFDEMIRAFLAKHPHAPKELKTKPFINGSDGWSKVDADERKNFLRAVCDLVAECAKIFALALSFESFDKADTAKCGKSYWLCAAMFVAALVQQKMQRESSNKGLTVLINNMEKITYGELADKLKLQLARQEWNTDLDLIAGKTKREVGDDCHLTWNVVYASGPAKGLGRYFSNGNKAPGSTQLNPKDREQVAEYERKLKEIYKCTYQLRKVKGEDRVIKVPRSE
jgi:hypothetical protein